MSPIRPSPFAAVHEPRSGDGPHDTGFVALITTDPGGFDRVQGPPRRKEDHGQGAADLLGAAHAAHPGLPEPAAGVGSAEGSVHGAGDARPLGTGAAGTASDAAAPPATTRAALPTTTPPSGPTPSGHGSISTPPGKVTPGSGAPPRPTASVPHGGSRTRARSTLPPGMTRSGTPYPSQRSTWNPSGTSAPSRAVAPQPPGGRLPSKPGTAEPPSPPPTLSAARPGGTSRPDLTTAAPDLGDLGAFGHVGTPITPERRAAVYAETAAATAAGELPSVRAPVSDEPSWRPPAGARDLGTIDGPLLEAGALPPNPRPNPVNVLSTPLVAYERQRRPVPVTFGAALDGPDALSDAPIDAALRATATDGAVIPTAAAAPDAAAHPHAHHHGKDRGRHRDPDPAPVADAGPAQATEPAPDDTVAIGTEDPTAPTGAVQGSDAHPRGSAGSAPAAPRAAAPVVDPDADAALTQLAAAAAPTAKSDAVKVQLDRDLAVQVTTRGHRVDVAVTGTTTAVDPLRALGPELDASLAAGGFSLGSFTAGEDRASADPGGADSGEPRGDASTTGGAPERAGGSRPLGRSRFGRYA